MAKKFELMSKNYTEIQVVAGADLAVGSFQTTGATNGFVGFENVLNGSQYTLITKAEKVLVEKAAVAIAAGESAYWNATNGNVTNVATGATLVGEFQEAAIAGDSHVHIVFDGSAAFLKL